MKPIIFIFRESDVDFSDILFATTDSVDFIARVEGHNFFWGFRYTVSLWCGEKNTSFDIGAETLNELPKLISSAMKEIRLERS